MGDLTPSRTAAALPWMIVSQGLSSHRGHMSGAQSIIGYASARSPLTTCTQMGVLRGRGYAKHLYSCVVMDIWFDTRHYLVFYTQLACDDYPSPFQRSHQLSTASWAFQSKTGVFSLS